MKRKVYTLTLFSNCDVEIFDSRGLIRHGGVLHAFGTSFKPQPPLLIGRKDPRIPFPDNFLNPEFSFPFDPKGALVSDCLLDLGDL